MRRPGEVNGPKLGAVAPPLDPLPVRGGDGCCFFAGGGILNGAGDASRVTIAESYRTGVPLRLIALRPTDASRLRARGFMGVVIRGLGRGRCLRRTRGGASPGPPAPPARARVLLPGRGGASL